MHNVVSLEMIETYEMIEEMRDAIRVLKIWTKHVSYIIKNNKILKKRSH